MFRVQKILKGEIVGLPRGGGRRKEGELGEGGGRGEGRRRKKGWSDSRRGYRGREEEEGREEGNGWGRGKGMEEEEGMESGLRGRVGKGIMIIMVKYVGYALDKRGNYVGS